MKLPKPSKSAKKLLGELETAGVGFYESLEISLRSKPSDLIAALERQFFGVRKQLLIELANLREDGITRFWKGAGAFFHREGDLFLLNTRNSLRKAWSPTAPLSEKQRLTDALIAASSVNPLVPGWIAPLRAGRVVPGPKNLRSQLAAAILDNWQMFRICANPECVAPYFLARRKDQKYCERGACTEYAQRKYSNASYHRLKKHARKTKTKKRRNGGK